MKALPPLLRRAAALLLLDLLLPLLAFLALSRLWHRRLWEHLGRHTALSWHLSPSDENGTLWFWWWLGQSRARGQALLYSDLTCHPDGEPLSFNNPNRADAWMAQPFLSRWGLPAGYDLALALVPVSSSLGAWLLLRTLGGSRLVALAGAMAFGFGSYSVLEAAEGRPVSSLLLFVPLALAPWSLAHQARSLGRRLAWAALAGALLALQAWAYIPYAFFLALAFAGSALAAALRPRPAAPRWHPVLQLVLAGLLAALLTAPYLHELLIVRKGGLAVAPLSPDQLVPRWDPGTLVELWRLLVGGERTPGAAPAGDMPPPAWFGAPYWLGVQGESMPWDYLWRPASPRAHRPVAVSGLLVGGAALLGLLVRRARPAVLVTLLLWLSTLGPHLSWRTERAAAQLVLVDGHRISLPVAWLLTLLPDLDIYLRPYRLVPFLVLASAATLVLAVDGLRPPLARAFGRRAALAGPAAVLVCLLPALVGLGHMATLPWSTWRLGHVGTHPFLEALASAPAEVAIAELPAGSGHALGGLQARHGHPRVEPLHDVSPGTRGATPPPQCYRTAFGRAMWAIGRADPASLQAVERGLSAEALARARQEGVHYVLLHPALYRDLRDVDLARVRQTLDERLGPPQVRELTLEVWALPEPPP